MSSAGFEKLNQYNKRILGLYNSKKGAGGPKASQSDVQYLSEILWNKKFDRDAAYSVGGVRIQSFSDYVSRMVFDYVQMLQDLSAKNLPAHAYTKEQLFAMQFGMTGVKVNMSLVPEIIADGVAPGLDKDGNYAWKDGQSFGSTVYGGNKAFIEHCCKLIGVEYTGQERLTAAEGFALAKVIQNTPGYTQNCGTIAVGVSYDHIVKMLGDDSIRMVIPYHKSSLNHVVAVMTNIDKYEDYTKVQNTRYRSTGKKLNKGVADFNYNDALRRTGDARAAAQEYLDWCREHDYIPKFEEFAWHENYYKLLEDFSCYDNTGAAAMQQDVKLNLPTDGSPLGSFRDLVKYGLEEEAILQAKQDAAIPSIIDDIKKTIPEYEASTKKKPKAITDAEKAVTTAGNNVTKAVKKLTSAQAAVDKALAAKETKDKPGRVAAAQERLADAQTVLQEAQQKFEQAQKVLEELTAQQESQQVQKQAKDSEGASLTEQQAEYFADSKVRDEDGNLLRVYHGTSEEFTVFDRTRARTNMDIQGSFFSPWEIDASGYGENVKAYYLNITNPAPEGVAYKALNKFKGQNGAGIKAREYLESLGYDGVNNGNEEYIAFNPEQIKLVENSKPTTDPDIRYSLKDNPNAQVGININDST